MVLPDGAMLILGALEHLTGERDRERLQFTMIQALCDLSGADEIVLHVRTEDDFRPILSIRKEGDPQVVEGEWPASPALIARARQILADPATSMSPCTMLEEGFIAHGLADPRGLASIVTLRYCDTAAEHPWWIGGFLKVYQNHINLIDDAECDTLTGLFNRKTFEGRISRILALQGEPPPAPAPGRERRAIRDDDHHWLAVVDIDHFKNINDRFGHLYGDEVLILLARLMMRGFRMEDRLFRFGGEEFVIVLSPCNAEGAAMVLERFRRAIESYEFPQVGRVTVSMGYTQLRADDVASVSVGRADAALYYAKRNGRNRVCSYEALAEAGAIAVPQAIESFAAVF